MPNATVNAIAALDGPVAGAEQAERGPRSGGQHQVARQRRPVPAQQARRPPARSCPAAGRAAAVATPSEVWQAAHSKAASCSTSLIDAQPVGGVDEQVVGVLHETAPAPTRPRSSSTRKAGTSIGRPIGVRLPARRRRRARPRPMPSSARIVRQRPRAVARLAGQAEVLEQVAAHRQRRGAGHAVALVAHQDGRARRSARRPGMASSKRGSKPVR